MFGLDSLGVCSLAVGYGMAISHRPAQGQRKSDSQRGMARGACASPCHWLCTHMPLEFILEISHAHMHMHMQNSTDAEFPCIMYAHLVMHEQTHSHAFVKAYRHIMFVCVYSCMRAHIHTHICTHVSICHYIYVTYRYMYM